MAGDVTLVWTVPPSALQRGIGNYAERLLSAVFDLAQYFAARIEAYAKQHAPWTDRTGNARQGLTGRAFRTATAVTILLFGAASYQIWLELAHGGHWGIILKALEANYSPYMKAIEGLMR